MKKHLLSIFLILATFGFLKAQETPPTVLKPVNSQFYIHLPDSTIWQYKGRAPDGTDYGWHRVGKYNDFKQYLKISDTATTVVTKSFANRFAKTNTAVTFGDLTANGTVNLGSAAAGATKNVNVLNDLTVSGSSYFNGSVAQLLALQTTIGRSLPGKSYGLSVNSSTGDIYDYYTGLSTTPDGLYGWVTTADGYKWVRVNSTGLGSYIGLADYAKKAGGNAFTGTQTIGGSRILTKTDSTALSYRPYGTYTDFFGKTGYLFGDSIGFGASATSSPFYWPNILAQGLGMTIVNNSTSGSTLSKQTPINPFTGVNMIDKISTIPNKTASIAQLIIALGTNDAGVNGSNYTTTNFKTDYRTVLDSAIQKRGFKARDITILSPYYVTETGFNYYATISSNPAPTRARFLAFKKAIEEIALEYGVNYYDVYSVQAKNDTTSYAADGLHPTNPGHALIASGGLDFYRYRLSYGTKTQLSTTTPISLNLGGTVGSNTAGNAGNLKVKTLDNGSVQWGIGVSAGKQEYQVSVSSTHNFYVAGTEVGVISPTGYTNTSSGASSGNNFINTNANGAAAGFWKNDANKQVQITAWGSTFAGSTLGPRAGSGMISWDGVGPLAYGTTSNVDLNFYRNSALALNIGTGGTLKPTGTLILPATATGTAGTDSLVTKNPTTNVVGKISPNYYVPGTRTLTINGTTLDLSANRTFSTGTLTIDATAASYTMAPGTRYVSDAATLVNFTLPTTANVGDIFIITGYGSGLWKISQNTGQVIHGATDTSTGTGGGVTATGRYNSIQIVCVKANTDFTIQSSQGAVTIL